MQLICVFSTLAASVEYTRWKAGPNDVPTADGSVTIKGGAGVANQHVMTPRGVATMVTAEQLEILEDNKVFQLHVANGFVTVDKTLTRPPTADDADNAAAGLEGRDNSAPLVPQDFSGKPGDAPPVVNGETGGQPTAVAASGPGSAGRRNRR